MNKNSIKTSNIDLAAVLCIYDGEYSLSVDFHGVGTFTFPNSPELSKAHKDFWAKKILVEPHLFSMHKKSLKARLDEQKKGK